MNFTEIKLVNAVLDRSVEKPVFHGSYFGQRRAEAKFTSEHIITSFGTAFVGPVEFTTSAEWGAQ